MKRGRPKKTWLIAVIEQRRKVGLNGSDANSRSRWRLGVNTICSRGKSGHIRYSETKPDKKLDYYYFWCDLT